MPSVSILDDVITTSNIQTKISTPTTSGLERRPQLQRLRISAANRWCLIPITAIPAATAAGPATSKTRLSIETLASLGWEPAQSSHEALGRVPESSSQNWFPNESLPPTPKQSQYSSFLAVSQQNHILRVGSHCTHENGYDRNDLAHTECINSGLSRPVSTVESAVETCAARSSNRSTFFSSTSSIS